MCVVCLFVSVCVCIARYLRTNFYFKERNAYRVLIRCCLFRRLLQHGTVLCTSPPPLLLHRPPRWMVCLPAANCLFKQRERVASALFCFSSAAHWRFVVAAGAALVGALVAYASRGISLHCQLQVGVVIAAVVGLKRLLADM